MGIQLHHSIGKVRVELYWFFELFPELELELEPLKKPLEPGSQFHLHMEL
jgi:hypothetical protein